MRFQTLALGGDAGLRGGAVEVGGLPVPGQEVSDLPGRMVDDAGEDVGKVTLGTHLFP